MKTQSNRDARKPDEARSAGAAKIARLRALRLSKEASDREAELSAAALKAEAKAKPRATRATLAKARAAVPATGEADAPTPLAQHAAADAVAAEGALAPR